MTKDQEYAEIFLDKALRKVGGTMKPILSASTPNSEKAEDKEEGEELPSVPRSSPLYGERTNEQLTNRTVDKPSGERVKIGHQALSSEGRKIHKQGGLQRGGTTQLSKKKSPFLVHKEPKRIKNPYMKF